MAETQLRSDRVGRRQRLEHMWVVGVVLFTLVRFVVAWGTLHRYGLNVWIFGIIDLGTAVPYGVGTARLVTSLVDHRGQAAARWGALAAFTFLAPYLYVFWAGRTGAFPPEAYLVVALLAVCLGVNAAVTVTRRVRTARHPGGPLAVD